MSRYIVKRLLFAVLALFILLSLVFFLMTAIPTDPIPKVQGESIEAHEAKLAAIGWYEPVINRYFIYWQRFFDGSFGQVFNKEGTPLVTYFFENVPNTLYVAFMAYILAIILGFLFGVISAVYRGKWQDTFINVVSVIFISVPSFIVGMLLLKLAGAIRIPQTFVNFGDPNFDFGTFIGSSIMPVLALTFGLASTLTYYVRNELVEVLSQDYIKTAMSKGLTKRQIIWNHGIRNSLIPALSILGPSFLYIITGSVVIEYIFGVKGIARMLYDAVVANQFYVILFQTFFISSLYFLITLILDVSYTIIDPRIKLAESSETSIYQLIKSTSQRLMWKKKWIEAKGPEYKWVSSSDSLFFALKETKTVDYKNKTVSLDDKIKSTYGIDSSIQYLVIGKDILKITSENLQK